MLKTTNIVGKRECVTFEHSRCTVNKQSKGNDLYQIRRANVKNNQRNEREIGVFLGNMHL
jgi:hypothetical protein